MSLKCALLVALLLALRVDSAFAAAPAAESLLPAFGKASDWQITYQTTWFTKEGAPDKDLEEPVLMVSYKAPSLLHIWRGGLGGLHRGCQRPRYPSLLSGPEVCRLVAECEDPEFFSECNLALGGLTEPLDSSWEEVKEALRQGGKGESATFALLPEETVAGWPCLVLHSVSHVTDGDDPGEWVCTQWFDCESTA